MRRVFQNADGSRNGGTGIKVGSSSSTYNALPYMITNQNMDDRISNDQITNWDEAYSWGDHALAGYLTQELDPIFTEFPMTTITVQDIAKWNEASADGGGMTDAEREMLNEAHGWGNHAEAGYIKPNDTIFGGSYQN